MSGAALVGIVQKMIDESTASTGTTDFTAGTVTSTSPLVITVEERLPLSEACLILSPFCYRKAIDFERHGEQHDDVLLWEGLEIGNKVHMLRVNKGKKYYVLCKEGGAY